MPLSRVATRILEPVDFPDQDQLDLKTSHENGDEEKNDNDLQLHQTLSLVAPPKSKCIQQIPNGGLQAWLQVLGSFVLFHNTWGVTNAFGVFQSFYVNTGYIQSSPSDISIIGAVQAFFLLGFGLLTGPLFDKGYFYHLLAAGSFLTVFGVMMTSLCKEYWQVLLARESPEHLCFFRAYFIRGHMRRPRIGMPLCSIRCHYSHIFHDEEDFRHRHSSYGGLDRRHYLSHHVLLLAANHRLPMGCKSYRLHDARYLQHLDRRYASEDAYKREEENVRSGRLQGAAFHALRPWSGDGLRRRLHPILLHL